MVAGSAAASWASAPAGRCRPVGTVRRSGPTPLLSLRALAVAVTAAAGATAWPLAGPQRGRRGLALGPGRRSLAAVDPDLDADPAERGACLVEAVVDVSAQRVQRHPALAVELRPGHLSAAEAARALHPDALGAALHRGLHGLAHGTAEGDAAGQLLGYALRYQLGVDLGVLDLEDVELHLLAGQLLQITADAVSLGAAAADDDAGPGGVDVHPYPVHRALDLHLGDAGPLHAALKQPPDGDILGDVVLVQLVGVPPALEVGGDTQPEPVRVHFLAH